MKSNYFVFLRVNLVCSKISITFLLDQVRLYCAFNFTEQSGEGVLFSYLQFKFFLRIVLQYVQEVLTDYIYKVTILKGSRLLGHVVTFLFCCPYHQHFGHQTFAGQSDQGVNADASPGFRLG